MNDEFEDFDVEEVKAARLQETQILDQSNLYGGVIRGLGNQAAGASNAMVGGQGEL